MARPLQRSEETKTLRGGLVNAVTRRLLHSSYERGCQEKILLPAPRRDAGVVTYIQPSHSRKGVGLAALARRRLQRRCQPQGLVLTRRFQKAVVLDAIRLRSYASEGLAEVPTIILCETRGLQLFWVIRGGIGLSRRLAAKLQHTERLMSVSILSLEPEHRKNRYGHHRGMKTLGDHLGSVKCSSGLRF
jgi:hypothetical protein